METKDFPKRYGGDLEWEWGQLPDLDDETRAAVEKDGNQGWVRGPCQWLDGKRVTVGSEKGKLRTPDEEVEKKRPVAYAADYTVLPVHAGKDLWHLSTHKGRTGANGTAEPHHHAEAEAAAATGGTTAAAIIESKTASKEPDPSSTTAQTTHQSTTVDTQASSDSSGPQQQPHPPSQPQPGPVPAHAAAMTQAIADKLSGESVSIIPETANGHANKAENAGHGEVTVASDPSKGLAIESEKLAMADQNRHGGDEKEKEIERPPMERFVTATEV